MSEYNYLIHRFRTIEEEDARRKAWEAHCTELVELHRPRHPFLGALRGFLPKRYQFSRPRPYRRGPLVRVQLRPSDVDVLLWLALAFALAILAATWLPGVM